MFSTVPLTLCPNPSIESSWFEILHRSLPKKLLFGCIYRPPHSPTSDLHNFLNDIEVLLTQYREVIICGDFNIDISKHSHKSTLLLSFVESHSLHIPKTPPTRITQSSSTTIDLFLLTSKNSILSSGTLDHTPSDHLPIYCSFSWPIAKKCTTLFISRRNKKHFNPDEFCSDLSSAPWCISEIFDDPDDKLYVLESLFNLVLDYHQPLKKIRVKKSGVPWMNKNIHREMYLRNKLHRTFLKTRTIDDWNLYKHARNQVNIKLRTAKHSYFHNLTTRKPHPTVIWNALNPCMNKPSLAKNFNSEPSVVADTFNRHLTSFTTNASQHYIVIPTTPTTPVPILEFTPITTQECQEHISNLPLKKSCGTDGMTANLLSISAPILSAPLANIINSSLSLGQFPSLWKLAIVHPLHKSNISISPT